MKTIPVPVIRPSESGYLQMDRPHIAVQARDDPNAPECAQVYLLVYKTRQGRWAKRSEFVKVISHNLLGLGTATAKASVKAQIEKAIAAHGARAATRKLVEVVFYRGITLLAVESVDVNPKHIFQGAGIMNRDHFIFELDNKSEAVATRNQITTTIPNTGALKTTTGENYIVQVVTILLYRTTKLRYAVRLGVAGANGYFRYAWGPQDSEDPAYVVVDAVKEDAAVGDLLETAQKHHAMLFEGHENTAALLNAIETLTKRATAVLDKT